MLCPSREAEVIRQKDFGVLPTGQRVDAYTLSNSRGMSMEAITYGGIVTQLHAPDRDGNLADVVCGFGNLQAYLAGHPYFGCIAGRVAGRITAGRFKLDGVEHSLALNDPPNHLHGGWMGLDKRLWNAEPISENSLRLSYLSPDGEEGYPGNVQTSATYSLTDANEFVIEFEATTDRATPLSLTHHGYFNLAGEGSGRIDDHILRIFATGFAPADENMALKGIRKPVAGQANDFTRPRRIGEALGGLWKNHGDVYFLGGSAAAHLFDPHSGREMWVRTTQPCLQLYTGVSLDGMLIGKSGRPYVKHGALCLECEGFPDGPNRPELGDIILRPGQRYRQRIIHAFTTVG